MRGLTALDGPGADGLRLELLLILQRARPEERVAHAIQTIAERISAGLNPTQSARFRHRAGIERALNRQ